MKLIFALGNPGPDYQTTRHNLAWFYLDSLDLNWQQKAKFQALAAESTIAGQKVIFIKPLTFYNLVGQSARAVLDFYKLPTNQMLVLHDDLALPIGTIRTRLGGSGGGNNGIKSLNAHLGPDYPRLRLGIAPKEARRSNDTDFVLTRFSTQELEIVQAQQPTVKQLINDFANDKLDTTTYRSDSKA